MIGLDIGFGDVKVAYLDGGKIKTFKFCNSIRQKMRGGDALVPGALEYEYQGRSLILTGEPHVDNLATTTIEYLMKYGPLLAYRALRGPELKEISLPIWEVATGLPIGYFNKRFRDELISGLSRIAVNHEALNLSVRVLPQGVGIQYDFRLSDDGRLVAGTDIDAVILDIGFNTVDVVVMEKGEAVGDESDMLQGMGLTVAVQNLEKELRRRFPGFFASHQVCLHALISRSIRWKGERFDLSEPVGEIVADYVEQLSLATESRWGRFINGCEKLILAGGGAYLLREREFLLPEGYRKNLYVPPFPEYANARGYLKSLYHRR